MCFIFYFSRELALASVEGIEAFKAELLKGGIELRVKKNGEENTGTCSFFI
jgi:hypothetical protein